MHGPLSQWLPYRGKINPTTLVVGYAVFLSQVFPAHSGSKIHRCYHTDPGLHFSEFRYWQAQWLYPDLPPINGEPMNG